MLRACVIEFGGYWDNFLPLAEFSYNNSYHSSIDIAPFEALYGRRCRSPIGWFDAFEVRPWGTDLLRESLDKVKCILEKLIEAQSRQNEYADRKVRDLEFMEGEQVLLKVSPMQGFMWFGKRGKLSPRFIGAKSSSPEFVMEVCLLLVRVAATWWHFGSFRWIFGCGARKKMPGLLFASVGEEE
ncbi:uncharacterized protein [Solanum lycopersicum]|uniref:uncharacterized protein n=1 Tax=Solanum lycopersicum TaxID=4081 RepID=UPI00374951FA